MNVIELADYRLDAVRVAQRPTPSPGPGQILLRMRAATLNYRDLLILRGQYAAFSLPLVLGSDGVGEVVAKGEGVSRFQIGDRVSPTYIPSWIDGPVPPDAGLRLGGPLPGVLAEYVAVSEQAAVRAPSHLNDVAAATLPVAGVTAWHALFGQSSVQPGQTVVVQGTGGVSLFALAFARTAGAEVIVTSGSHEKLARATSLGAHHTIHYREVPDWERRVLEITDGRGADHVIDIAGGDGLVRSIAAARMGGTVHIIGLVRGNDASIPLLSTMQRRVRIQGVSVGHRASFEAMVRAIELHRIRPAVDRVFPFFAVREALAHLEKGEHFGKIALSFEDARV